MVHINLNDILDVEQMELAKKLSEAGPELRLTMSVRDQYRASSKTDLAENWLRTWYIAEAIAVHTSECECDFEEGEEGAGDFEFRFTVSNAKGMAKALAEFASVFDPDDLEAGALIYDEAHDWLQRRGDVKSRFPDIEESYRQDAQVAAEQEGYLAGEEVDVDYPDEEEYSDEFQ